jgi:acyl transferase domain-containing protein
MNPSVSLAHNSEVVGQYTNDASLEREPETVDQLIARVLRRAHRTAAAVDAPNEERAILQLAHSFADELATANPRFDRLRFIRTATGDLP